MLTIMWLNHIIFQLDENVNTDTLEKCVGYFNATHPLYLLASGETRVHQTNLVNDLGKALVAACESIRTDAAIVQVLLQVRHILLYI